MNNLDVTKFSVQELNAMEMVEVEGGAFPWGAFWNSFGKGFTIGVGVGAAGAAAYYAMA